MKIIKISINTFFNIEDIFSITEQETNVVKDDYLRQSLFRLFCNIDTLIVYSNNLKDIPYKGFSNALETCLPGYVFHFNDIPSKEIKVQVESRAFSFNTMESLNNFLDRMSEKGVVVHEVYTTLDYTNEEKILQQLNELNEHLRTIQG